jgi:hypothetical protein
VGPVKDCADAHVVKPSKKIVVKAYAENVFIESSLEKRYGSLKSDCIRLVDVILPTSSGVEIRKRCVTRPTEHQEILLQYLGLKIP